MTWHRTNAIHTVSEMPLGLIIEHLRENFFPSSSEPHQLHCRKLCNVFAEEWESVHGAAGSG